MTSTLAKCLSTHTLRSTQELNIFLEDVMEANKFPTWCSAAPILIQTWAEKVRSTYPGFTSLKILLRKSGYSEA